MLHLLPIQDSSCRQLWLTQKGKEEIQNFTVFSLYPYVVFSRWWIFWLLRSFNRAWLDTGFHLPSSITTQICLNRSCHTPLQYDSEENQTGDVSVQTRDLQAMWALIWSPQQMMLSEVMNPWTLQSMNISNEYSEYRYRYQWLDILYDCVCVYSCGLY